MVFDVEKAEQELREAFYQVKDELNLTKEDIDFYVERSVIYSIQYERERMQESLKQMKVELETRFRNYRIRGRIKSLSSIFGKFMKKGKINDVFGFKIITDNIYECYKMKEWIEANFSVVEFKDRIKNPKTNGYSDLRIVVEYPEVKLDLEFIIQSNKMYVDSHTLQAHWVVYPWKYHSAILNLPAEYKQIEI